MSNVIIVGAQWGDEGKGKVVDFLTQRADIVVRAQGGSNAGHTVYNQGQKYVLHMMPSGILWPGKHCVIGNGVVLDPLGLLEEITALEERGITISADNLLISHTAHLVLPYHRGLDLANERQRHQKIGTTGRGIGPAYGDKVNRCGLRVNDLKNAERFRTKCRARAAQLNGQLADFDIPAIDDTIEAYLQAGRRLASHIQNTVAYLYRAIAAGKNILFEGAQGAYLDIDHGTYPFVTSSNTTAGGACTGSGVAPNKIDRIIGVTKAYTTRVGAGPFVTENDAFSERLHRMGREFGATTGRKRRCGWLDAVMLRFAVMVNGLNDFALTNLDGLDGLPQLKICTAYELDGERLDVPPPDYEDLERCRPVYEELPVWTNDITRCKSLSDLPAAARTYLDRITELTDTPISILGVGPDRTQTIVCDV